tara:strand:- start:2427 stop:2690 length:264 start_codon:yes stop_codon:yes gene_type:complete
MSNTVANNLQQFVQKANVLLDKPEEHKKAAKDANIQMTLDALSSELELKGGRRRRKSRRKSKKRRKSRRKSKKRRKRTKKRRRRRRR